MRRALLLWGLQLLYACPRPKPDSCPDTSSACIDQDEDGYTRDVDCEDQDPEIHPDATEICDGVDNDCDGLSDLADPDLVGDDVYMDADGDGSGEGDQTVKGCAGERPYVTVGGDCADDDPAIHPGVEDPCDGVDQDCDGGTDEDAEFSAWFLDADEDGYGDPDERVEACDTPDGRVTNDEDCDDGDAEIHPRAHEEYDRVDNDCDGEIDEAYEYYYWSGLFFVGHFDEAWTCVNLYAARGTPYSREALCDGCDYSLRIDAVYEPGGVSEIEECDWDDFRLWEEITSFSSVWGFAYEPDFYPYPVAYYYYADYWVKVSALQHGTSFYGYDYTRWYLLKEEYAPGNTEAGVFYGYTYIY